MWWTVCNNSFVYKLIGLHNETELLKFITLKESRMLSFICWELLKNERFPIIFILNSKSMRNKMAFLLLIVVLLCTTSCSKVFDDCIDESKEHGKQPKVTAFATGLTAPLGVEADAKGQLWITEAGTGITNNGRLSINTSNGKVYRRQ